MSEILYQKLGIDAEAAKDLTSEKVEEIFGKYNDSLKTSFLESEDFFKNINEAKLPSELKNKLLNDGQAKIAGMSKKALVKEFGLTDEDLSTFTEDDLKDINKYISKTKNIHLTKLNSGNKDISILQSENLDLKQKVSEYQSQISSLEEKFNSDLNEKLTNKEVEVMTMIEVGKMNANILGNPLATFKLIYPNLQNKYNVHVDNGVVELRSKENPQFKVETEINGKKQFLTIEKAIENEYKHIGLWIENKNQQVSRGTVTVISNVGDDRVLPKHVLDRMSLDREV
jgi:hypothetical protein